MKPRKYLTKSIFKVGLECPRKLFYLNKSDEYFNESVEDPFLEALARGGYQVGALAQLKYPAGVEVKSKSHEEALAETAPLMAKEDIVIFEGAFSAEKYFVRADIAIKSKEHLRIIEVKSKSFKNESDDDDDEFLSPKYSKPGKPKIYSKWIPYLYDLAFQVYVARLQYPNLKVVSSLMLLDKFSKNPEEGLHQMFLVKPVGERGKEVSLTKAPGPDFKGYQILKEIDLTEVVDQIINGQERSDFIVQGNMAAKAAVFAQTYLNNEKFSSSSCFGEQCKKCEFRGTSETLKSGFDECWLEVTKIEAASSKTLYLDLWNYRSKSKALAAQKYLLKDLTENELGSGVTVDRQKIIIAKEKSKDLTPWIEFESLRSEMDSWIYPLHFIDFETCTPGIPFKKDFPPYSETAFQFSHHMMQKDGSVSHAGEFIDLTPGKFPSFGFVRELKRQLEQDAGTIFRYSSHENSVLNRIEFLLRNSSESDKDELISFIHTITSKKASTKKDDYLRRGDRCMNDLLEVIKNCYLSPLMGNSNSLKYVLPAVLNESEFLKNKYSKPIYGSKDLPSRNFKNHQWITVDGIKYSADPYQALPSLFSPEDLLRIENVMTEEEAIRNGGAAMMAYSKSQFTEMSSDERERIRQSLLKYCELDTLAMVMLVEYWRDICKRSLPL